MPSIKNLSKTDSDLLTHTLKILDENITLWKNGSGQYGGLYLSARNTLLIDNFLIHCKELRCLKDATCHMEFMIMVLENIQRHPNIDQTERAMILGAFLNAQYQYIETRHEDILTLYRKKIFEAIAPEYANCYPLEKKFEALRNFLSDDNLTETSLIKFLNEQYAIIENEYENSGNPKILTYYMEMVLEIILNFSDRNKHSEAVVKSQYAKLHDTYPTYFLLYAQKIINNRHIFSSGNNSIYNPLHESLKTALSASLFTETTDLSTFFKDQYQTIQEQYPNIPNIIDHYIVALLNKIFSEMHSPVIQAFTLHAKGQTLHNCQTSFTDRMIWIILHMDQQVLLSVLDIQYTQYTDSTQQMKYMITVLSNFSSNQATFQSILKKQYAQLNPIPFEIYRDQVAKEFSSQTTDPLSLLKFSTTNEYQKEVENMNFEYEAIKTNYPLHWKQLSFEYLHSKRFDQKLLKYLYEKIKQDHIKKIAYYTVDVLKTYSINPNRPPSNLLYPFHAELDALQREISILASTCNTSKIETFYCFLKEQYKSIQTQYSSDPTILKLYKGQVLSSLSFSHYERQDSMQIVLSKIACHADLCWLLAVYAHSVSVVVESDRYRYIETASIISLRKKANKKGEKLFNIYIKDLWLNCIHVPNSVARSILRRSTSKTTLIRIIKHAETHGLGSLMIPDPFTRDNFTNKPASSKAVIEYIKQLNQTELETYFPYTQLKDDHFISTLCKQLPNEVNIDSDITSIFNTFSGIFNQLLNRELSTEHFYVFLTKLDQQLKEKGQEIYLRAQENIFKAILYQLGINDNTNCEQIDYILNQFAKNTDLLWLCAVYASNAPTILTTPVSRGASAFARLKFIKNEHDIFVFNECIHKVNACQVKPITTDNNSPYSSHLVYFMHCKTSRLSLARFQINYNPSHTKEENGIDAVVVPEIIYQKANPSSLSPRIAKSMGSGIYNNIPESKTNNDGDDETTSLLNGDDNYAVTIELQHFKR